MQPLPTTKTPRDAMAIVLSLVGVTSSELASRNTETETSKKIYSGSDPMFLVLSSYVSRNENSMKK